MKKEINEWKEKYNNLMEVLKSKDQKIADLENKLQTISTKQQKEKTKDQLAQLVENMEAKTEIESVSSILNEKEVQEEEKTTRKKRRNK